MEPIRLPFFIRDQVRSRIEKRIEALAKGYRQNIGLIGAEGLGKTHILKIVFEVLCAKPEIIPIYIDAQSIDFEQMAERWINAMLSGIFLSQNVRPPVNSQSLLSAADIIAPKTVEKIRHFKKAMRKEQGLTQLKELFSFTETLAEETGKKIILMIDEFDALTQIPVSDPFAALGKEIMIQKNTFYLVTSSHLHKAREIFREKLSLLFGNFEILELGPFSFEETVQFIEKRMPGWLFTQSQQYFMIRLTDGHPAYLELLMDQLQCCLAASGRHYDMKMMENVIPSQVLFEAFNRELFDEKGRLSILFHNRIKQCLQLGKDSGLHLRGLLAVANGRRRLAGVASFIDRRMPETKKILERLREEGFLSRQGSFYVIEDALFRFWLREVYQPVKEYCFPDLAPLRDHFMHALESEYQKHCREENPDLMMCLENLFKEFRNDVLEVDQKKFQFPLFTEIAVRPSSGRNFPMLAKNSKVRWMCQITREQVREEDVTLFLDEIKRARKHIQKKILITLNGIDQNAKLLAQEANIQLWNLRCFNKLLDLYDLPKIVAFSTKENDGSNLGAMASSLHTA